MTQTTQSWLTKLKERLGPKSLNLSQSPTHFAEDMKKKRRAPPIGGKDRREVLTTETFVTLSLTIFSYSPLILLILSLPVHSSLASLISFPPFTYVSLSSTVTLSLPSQFPQLSPLSPSISPFLSPTLSPSPKLSAEKYR